MSEKTPLCAMNCCHRFYELEDFFKSAKTNGYSQVELWTGPQHFFLDYQQYESPDRLLHLEDQYELKIIGICPEQTNPKPHNMAAKDSAMQERVLAYFKNAIDVAAAVKAKQVVVTSGWAFYNEPLKIAYQRSVKMLQQLSEYAETKKMLLAIEALQKEESLLANTTMDLKYLLSDVNRPSLKVCLDTGAMAAAGETIQDYFDVFSSDIVHSHFVDVKGTTTHLAWGDGQRNMSEDLAVFVQNKYSGFYSIEIVNSQYFRNPQKADAQSMAMYRRMVKK